MSESNSLQYLAFTQNSIHSSIKQGKRRDSFNFHRRPNYSNEDIMDDLKMADSYNDEYKDYSNDNDVDIDEDGLIQTGQEVLHGDS